MDSPLVVANGIDATTGDPLLSPLEPSALARLIGDGYRDLPFTKALAARAHSAKDGLGFGNHDPRRLDEVGWGAVFPKGIDPAVRAALKPLLTRREGEAGTRFKVFDDVDPEVTWREFLSTRHAPVRGVIDPDRVPYYLLLVGPPTVMSWRFQRQLGTPHAVGRIDFGSPEEYQRFADGMADRVLPGLSDQPPFSVVAPRNDGDLATQWSSSRLAKPLAKELADEGSAAVTSTIGHGADRAAFLAGFDTDGEQRLLLTASHGVGYTADEADQVRHQGALVTSSWVKGSGRVDAEHDLIRAEDVANINPKGLIAMIVACFGAGTPLYDTFAELQRQPEYAPDPLAAEPFTAALPRALLSHPSGPASAIVSHVDRAWSTTFVGPLRESQTRTFKSIIKKVLRGVPIGAAMEDMTAVYAQAGAELAEALYHVDRGRRAQPEEINDCWLESADAGGYVILGDPAAQLGIQQLGKP